MDDRLSLMDQGSFLGLRALGHQPCFHATWTYERPVDLDAVRRVNENLRATLLGRLVERSPLPGGRHRWVTVDRAPEVEIEDVPPREKAMAMGASTLPVGCSNYGEVPISVPRLDGGDADDFWVRLNEPGVTAADLDRIGGQLYVLSGRALGTVFLSTIAQPLGGGLSRDDLYRHVTATLAEFGLTGASSESDPGTTTEHAPEATDK